MIDIRCHILPNVDDGAKSMSESVVMAQAAAKQGITQMIATPNLQEAQDIYAAVNALNEQLQAEGIDVTILPGQEIAINTELIADIEAGWVLTLNDTNSYVLLELPEDQLPQNLTQLLFDLQIAGYLPIIAQPERHQQFHDHPDALYRMVKNGALIQINAQSVLGKAGKKAKLFAEQLIEANLAHFVASNAHDTRKRGNFLPDAYKAISKQHGDTVAYKLQENSELLVLGEMVHKNIPTSIKPKKWWKLF